MVAYMYHSILPVSLLLPSTLFWSSYKVTGFQGLSNPGGPLQRGQSHRDWSILRRGTHRRHGCRREPVGQKCDIWKCESLKVACWSNTVPLPQKKLYLAVLVTMPSLSWMGRQMWKIWGDKMKWNILCLEYLICAISGIGNSRQQIWRRNDFEELLVWNICPKSNINPSNVTWHIAVLWQVICVCVDGKKYRNPNVVSTNLTAALHVGIVAVILTFAAERLWVVRPEEHPELRFSSDPPNVKISTGISLLSKKRHLM